MSAEAIIYTSMFVLGCGAFGLGADRNWAVVEFMGAALVVAAFVNAAFA